VGKARRKSTCTFEAMADSDSDSSSDTSGVRLTRLEHQATGGETVFIPSDLPIRDGMIDCRPELASRVSEITLGFGAADLSDPEPEDDEEEIVPTKGLNERGNLRNLLNILEEDLSLSDEDDDDDDSDDSSDDKEEVTKDPLDDYEKYKGKAIMNVTDHMVNDHYGDNGWYTGSVTVEALVPHGKGMLLYSNSRIYDGEWEDGKWHGQGSWQNINGDVYDGAFRYEKRHGYGVYKWENGNVYDGEFKDDQRHGKGKFSFANGTVYEGDFANGNFEGKGSYSFGTGMYEGEWKAGKYHGKGFLLNADGSSYTGSFEAGLQHGEGEEFRADGTQVSGWWARGRLI